MVDTGEDEHWPSGPLPTRGAGHFGARAADCFVLQTAVEGLVAEAWIKRLRDRFLRELEHSLAAFRERIADCRAEHDDWRDDLDGGVVLYDAFRPNLWKSYQESSEGWNTDRERILESVSRLRRIDVALMGESDTIRELRDS